MVFGQTPLCSDKLLGLRITSSFSEDDWVIGWGWRVGAGVGVQAVGRERDDAASVLRSSAIVYMVRFC